MHWNATTLIAVLVALYVARKVIGWIGRRGSSKNIEVVDVGGIIIFNSKLSSKFGRLMERLRDFKDRPKRPLAVIVRINSPGGTVGASQEIYDALRGLRESGIKVVAHLEDVAASGGLYVALAADYIVSNPGTMTGSIGVIMHGYEYGRLLERFQIGVRTVKAGLFKDILSPTREMTDAERALLQGLVDDTHRQFRTAVMESRHLSREDVERFADGRILTGSQARELKLVDAIGGFDMAIAAARALANIPVGKERIGYPQKSSFTQSLSERFNIESRLEALLPSAELMGVPLWLMPRF